jgi:hypothetical protein
LTISSSLAQPPNTGDELMEQTRFAFVEALGVEGLFGQKKVPDMLCRKPPSCAIVLSGVLLRREGS